MHHNSITKPILIIMCGLMGSGKSTIAMAIADKLEADLIRSDVIRKQLEGLKETDHHYDGFGKGIYSDKFFNSTYDTLFEKASASIKNNRPVIIDASFKKRKYRDRAKKLAKTLNLPFLIIETVCSDNETKRRLDERVKEGNDISDGRWDIYNKQKADFEPLIEFSSYEYIQLNMGKDLMVNVNDIIKKIKEVIR